MQGRKPKPTHLKILEGEKNKDRINTSEPKPTPIAPDCPKFLKGEAKKEWHRVKSQLESLGLLTQIDGTAFAAYCNAFGRWVQTEKMIQKIGILTRPPDKAKWPLKTLNDDAEMESPLKKMIRESGLFIFSPNGLLMQSPLLAVSNKAFDQMMRCCIEFGMTPSSRSRLKVNNEEPGEEFEKLLTRVK